ncbi:hypothetical protein OAS39_06760 [Pirellulales bacterium]|nr:hypothetical protein [Pirellulales bacterium]
MSPQSSKILLGALLVLLVSVILSRNRTSAGPSVAELTETALNGATASQRTAAAVQLADYGPEALPALRRVVSTSEYADVQTACLTGLAKLWDYQSMELFFEFMETGPPQIRGRAAQVVMRMTGRQRRYAANAPEAERRRLVEYMRNDWAEIAAASQTDRDELIRRLQESHEKP